MNHDSSAHLCLHTHCGYTSQPVDVIVGKYPNIYCSFAEGIFNAVAPVGIKQERIWI